MLVGEIRQLSLLDRSCDLDRSNMYLNSVMTIHIPVKEFGPTYRNQRTIIDRE